MLLLKLFTVPAVSPVLGGMVLLQRSYIQTESNNVATKGIGLVPIVIVLAGTLFLWGGVVFHTLRRYRESLEASRLRRQVVFGDALPGWVSQAPIDQVRSRAGELPPGAPEAEEAYRRALYRYNHIIDEPLQRMFAALFGHRRQVR